MGCCESSFLAETHPEKQQNHHRQAQVPAHQSHPSPSGGGEASFLTFSEFSLADLKAATNNFISDNIMSKSGEKAPNLVYKGCLQNCRWISIKKFTKLTWPNPKQFAVDC